jgi:transposase-like protein
LAGFHPTLIGRFCPTPEGITAQTFYRWRKEYGGLQVEQAKKMKELQKENAQLRRAIADLTVEKQILKDIAEGNF